MILPKLTLRRRPTPRKQRWPELTLEQILAWVDAHHDRTGEWPRSDSGQVLHAPREKWANINAALRLGLRGLERGSSLARLLQHERGVRNRKDLPRWTRPQILAWADAFHVRTGGEWPDHRTGPVAESPEDTWLAVDMALRKGLRGLRRGSSLAQLLCKHRGVRNRLDVPLLTVPQILAWVDAHYEATGEWPISESGAIAGAPGETWCAVSQALKKGIRGLPGGSSLARLLEECRGVANRLNKPKLSVEQILAWADAHHAHTGRWPSRTSGPIAGVSGELWSRVDTCLRKGKCQVPAGMTLARLLAQERGARKRGKPVRVLSVGQVLAWADAHYAEYGRWPTKSSGLIPGAPGESWNGVNMGLSRGLRGFPGGSSLPQLLAERRGARHKGELPVLTEAQVLSWVDEYFHRQQRWPTTTSGPIKRSGGETWSGVNSALANGTRGLPGGSSLARLLEAKRGVAKDRPLRPLKVEQLLEWVDSHYVRTGRWPTLKSGAIPGAPGENWYAIDQALKRGYRDLPRTTLARFLAERRGVTHPHDRPQLSEAQILAWADAFRARHGCWPRVRDGAIEGEPGENWMSVENALRLGLRGLTGGSSLRRFIRAHRQE